MFIVSEVSACYSPQSNPRCTFLTHFEVSNSPEGHEALVDQPTPQAVQGEQGGVHGRTVEGLQIGLGPPEAGAAVEGGVHESLEPLPLQGLASERPATWGRLFSQALQLSIKQGAGLVRMP